MLSDTLQSVSTASPAKPRGEFTVSSSDLAEQGVFLPSVTIETEETLIVDERAALRPAEMVENKLQQVLHASVGVSHLRLRNLLARRG